MLVGVCAIGTREIGVALLISSSKIHRLGGDNGFDGHCELVCAKKIQRLDGIVAKDVPQERGRDFWWNKEK